MAREEPIVLWQVTRNEVFFAFVAEIGIYAASRFTEISEGLSFGIQTVLFILFGFAMIGIWRVLTLVGIAAKMSTLCIKPRVYRNEYFDVEVKSGRVPAYHLRLRIADIKACPENDRDHDYLERQREANGLLNAILTAHDDALTRYGREVFHLGIRDAANVRVAHWTDRALWILISQGVVDGERISRPSHSAKLKPGKYQITLSLQNWLFPLVSETFEFNVTDAGIAAMNKVASR